MGWWRHRKAFKRNLSSGQGPIVDLDSISREPVSFRFDGVVHTIKPVSVEEFLHFTNSNSQFLTRIRDEKKLTAEELIESYAQVIGSVCPSVTADHIARMEQAQVAALYQLVIDTVTGQVKTGEGEKKRLRLGIYEQQSSSPTAPEPSAGP